MLSIGSKLFIMGISGYWLHKHALIILSKALVLILEVR